MKPIAIKSSNAERITAELKQVNGRASAHAFADAAAVVHAAGRVESHLQSQIGILAKRDWPGITAVIESGDVITSTSYAKKSLSKLATTTIKIRRTKSGWTLDSVEKTHSYCDQRRTFHVSLTADTLAQLQTRLADAFRLPGDKQFAPVARPTACCGEQPAVA